MLAGIINKIIYQSKNFIVAKIGKTKVCGLLPGAFEGMQVSLTGEMITHPKHGRQFNFTNYKILSDFPYLSSGFVRHVGPAIAEQLVKLFPNPVGTILKQPDKLSAVKGLSPQKIKEVQKSVKETIMYRQVCIDLEPCNLTHYTLARIYSHFKEGYTKILKNPYVLTEVDLIGFKKADNIAQLLGVGIESPQRVQAAMIYVLTQLSHEGHTFTTERELAIETYKLLGERIHPSIIEENITILPLPRENDRIYLPHLLKAENNAAKHLVTLMRYPAETNDISRYLEDYPINLSESQRKAVQMAFSNTVMVITGGPGTGKTETIKAVTSIYKRLFPTKKISLAAPTGRASQKMSEVTGLKAQTIHRLIGFKVDADLVIIDETSMVDIELLSKLLERIKPGTKIIFVGDPDQLPSVGPGRVLSELIEILPVIKLSQVFRQAQESNIIKNAYMINNGKIDLKTGKDFYFIHCETSEKILDTIKKYITKDNVDFLQVLSLMKKGTLGTDNLNTIMQNIATPGKGRYKIRDRVIQLVNNYSKNVFNGDIGIVVSTEPLIVRFKDQEIKYSFYESDQLSLAYAITVHKSQGSEFPIVVIPLSTQHYIMLNRQLLYTAVTRASKKVILLSDYKSLSLAVGNVKFQERNSAFAEKLKKMLA